MTTVVHYRCTERSGEQVLYISDNYSLKEFAYLIIEYSGEHGLTNFVVTDVVEPPKPTPSNSEQWIIALEQALNIPGSIRPVLAHSIMDGQCTYNSYHEASVAYQQQTLPIGWVVMKVSQLFARELV